MRHLVLSIIVATLAPGWAVACVVQEGWTRLTPEDADSHTAALFVAMQPVPVSQPFDVLIWLCADEDPKTISVTATMPAHQHGMNYRPAITTRQDGTLVASGLVFHMPGLWRVDVALETDAGTARYSSELTAR